MLCILAALLASVPVPLADPAAPAPLAPTDIAAAIGRGLDYLVRVQLADGSLPLCWVADAPDCQLEGTPWTGAMVSVALREIDDDRARKVRTRVRAHLESQREPGDLWRWWSHDDPRHEDVLPDLDDTACALFALGEGSKTHLAALERYRTKDGLYVTWTAPAAIAASSRRAIDMRLAAGFGEKAQSGNDVDCGVNLNVLRYAESAGIELPGVCAWLNGLLASGGVPCCSLYYLEPAHIYYLATHAWMAGATCLESGLRISAAPLLRSLTPRREGGAASSVAATSVFTLLQLGIADPLIAVAVRTLLAEQRPDGSWPATLSIAGQHGSAALDTGLVIEALALYHRRLVSPPEPPSRRRHSRAR